MHRREFMKVASIVGATNNIKLDLTKLEAPCPEGITCTGDDKIVLIFDPLDVVSVTQVDHYRGGKLLAHYDCSKQKIRLDGSIASFTVYIRDNYAK